MDDEGEPTRKKSKVDELEEGSSSSVSPEEDSSDDERMEDTHDLNRNYFTPAIMDVWPKILDNVTDPEDIVSLMNASPVFLSLLEKRKASAMLPLVLPILMKQGPHQFLSEDLFNCRLVSKQAKASVENTLGSLTVEKLHWLCWIRENSYTLMEPNAIQEFNNVFTQEFEGSPFLGRHCSLLLDEEYYRNSLEILRRYGQELHDVFFQIGMYGCPRQAMKIMKRALRFIPNIQSLRVSFSEVDSEDEDAWKNYRANFHHIPALKSLRKLELIYCVDHGLNPPPPSFLRPVLLAYGNQLTSLSCQSFVFRGNTWRSMRFPNLINFEVEFHVDESSKAQRKIYGNIAKLRCPKLESLTFTGAKMQLRAETFLALNNFRSTLKKLQFEDSMGTDIQLFQVDPLDVLEFPQLTLLTLCTVDTKPPARHLFHKMFPNLKELKFEPSDRSRGERAINSQRVLDDSVRRGYFTMFPDLQRIIWTRKKYLGGPPVCKETVFKRQNNG